MANGPVEKDFTSCGSGSEACLPAKKQESERKRSTGLDRSGRQHASMSVGGWRGAACDTDLPSIDEKDWSYEIQAIRSGYRLGAVRKKRDPMSVRS